MLPKLPPRKKDVRMHIISVMLTRCPQSVSTAWPPPGVCHWLPKCGQGGAGPLPACRKLLLSTGVAFSGGVVACLRAGPSGTPLWEALKERLIYKIHVFGIFVCFARGGLEAGDEDEQSFLFY